MQMRAAAEDFDMARVLGIRANTVIAIAFALSGLLAGVASILLSLRRARRRRRWASMPSCSRSSRRSSAGMGSLHGAVLGGFLLGALTVALQASLPLELRPYRDAFVFAVVLAVLVVRPQGLDRRPARASRETVARRRSLRDALVRGRSPLAAAAGGRCATGRRSPA